MSASKCKKGFFLVNREQLGKQVFLGEGRRGKRSHGRITILLIDSFSLLAPFVYFYYFPPPPFIFYLIPVTLLLDPWTMAYSKNFKKKFFFNKMTNVATYNLLPEAIAPFQ